MNQAFFRILLSSSVVLFGACGAKRNNSTTATQVPACTAVALPTGFPDILETDDGVGSDGREQPAIYLGPSLTSVAFGYASAGVRVRVDGQLECDRVKVTYANDLSVKGYLPVSRMRVFAKERRRLEGTPTYIAKGDELSLVRVLPGDMLEVEVRPEIGGSEFLGPYVTQLPVSMITGDKPTGADPDLRAGKIAKLTQTTAVYDRPGGQAIATLRARANPVDAHHVVILKEENGFYGVRVGYGPYLIGYIAQSQPGVELLGQEGVLGYGIQGGLQQEIPPRIEQESGTLVRVRAETRVRFFDQTVAKLKKEGYARVIADHGNKLDVFVAIDDRLAVRGLVPRDSVISLQPSVQPAAAAPVSPTPAATPSQPVAPAAPSDPQSEF